jgi:hypothetical protein
VSWNRQSRVSQNRERTIYTFQTLLLMSYSKRSFSFLFPNVCNSTTASVV